MEGGVQEKSDSSITVVSVSSIVFGPLSESESLSETYFTILVQVS